MERDHNSSDEGRLLPRHGGYRKLRSFQTAQAAYDGTVIFCDRFVDRRSRTRDQMVQAARSGVQNIAEGSMASATSRKMELKLTAVARASLEELLLDYEDFLRQRPAASGGATKPGHTALRHGSGPAPRVRRAGCRDEANKSDGSDPYSIRMASAEVAADTLICLVNQASFLLGRQLKKLEEQFLAEGGFTERLYRERSSARRKRRPNGGE